MEDKLIKSAKCCESKRQCSQCGSNEECTRWAKFVDKHSRTKGYAHFDRRTSLGDVATRSKVLNPEWVSRHGFWPLIQSEIKRSKFCNDMGIGTVRTKKPRVIRYCAHIDRCIYQRYAFLLNAAYNEYANKLGINDSAIAYRDNSGKCNIDYAQRAIGFVASTDECIILVADFEDYFERIDHQLLKTALCSVLETDYLPEDYYAVFRNITRYSSWSWESLVELRGLKGCKAARGKMNESETILDEGTFRSNVRKCAVPNLSGRGVPQGSPLSSVLSNIYLCSLDKDIREIVESSGGLYMRYCDDIFIAVPVVKGFHEQAMRTIQSVTDLIKRNPGTDLQPDKTRYLRFLRAGDSSTLEEIDVEGRLVKENARLDYLGFSFDGKSCRLVAKAITKYHYRMGRKARTVASQGRGKKNLYGTYSKHSKKITGKWSFVDYAKRASRKVDLREDQETSAVLHRNMEKIAKAVNRQKKKLQTEAKGER